jgi:hypothetical protein
MNRIESKHYGNISNATILKIFGDELTYNELEFYARDKNNESYLEVEFNIGQETQLVRVTINNEEIMDKKYSINHSCDMFIYLNELEDELICSLCNIWRKEEEFDGIECCEKCCEDLEEIYTEASRELGECDEIINNWLERVRMYNEENTDDIQPEGIAYQVRDGDGELIDFNLETDFDLKTASYVLFINKKDYDYLVVTLTPKANEIEYDIKELYHYGDEPESETEEEEEEVADFDVVSLYPVIEAEDETDSESETD